MSQSLDLRGTLCPVTAMRLKKYLKTLSPGVEVVVLADDKHARVDFPPIVEK